MVRALAVHLCKIYKRITSSAVGIWVLIADDGYDHKMALSKHEILSWRSFSMQTKRLEPLSYSGDELTSSLSNFDGQTYVHMIYEM